MYNFRLNSKTNKVRFDLKG